MNRVNFFESGKLAKNLIKGYYKNRKNTIKVEITIRKFWYDLLLAIIPHALGVFCGFLKNNKKDSAVSVGQQPVPIQIHNEQNQYIINNIVMPQKNSQPSAKGMSGGEKAVVCLIGLVMLVRYFLKFESQIIMGILIMEIFLESFFLTTLYLVTKKCYVDKSIKSIAIFNIVSTICSIVILYFMKNPFVNIDKEMILNSISNDGVFSLLSNIKEFELLSYQVIGVIFFVGFMLFTLIGTVHIFSIVNLALENRFTTVWRWMYKKTLSFCKSVRNYIIGGIFLLVMSFLFVSGILLSVI